MERSQHIPGSDHECDVPPEKYQPEQFLLAVMLLPPACLGETSVTAGSASESLFDDDEYYAWLYGGEEDEITPAYGSVPPGFPPQKHTGSYISR